MTLYEQFRAEGYREGYAEGQIASLLVVLEARKIHVPEGASRRLHSTTDRDTLRSWVVRAVTASRIEDVFDDSPKSPLA